MEGRVHEREAVDTKSEMGDLLSLLVQKSADARLRERPLGAGGDPGGQPARQWGTQSLD